MCQGNKYFTVHKQIIITSPYKPETGSILFTIVYCIFNCIGPNMTTNPKLKIPLKGLSIVAKYHSNYIAYFFYRFITSFLIVISKQFKAQQRAGAMTIHVIYNIT